MDSMPISCEHPIRPLMPMRFQVTHLVAAVPTSHLCERVSVWGLPKVLTEWFVLRSGGRRSPERRFDGLASLELKEISGP